MSVIETDSQNSTSTTADAGGQASVPGAPDSGNSTAASAANGADAWGSAYDRAQARLAAPSASGSESAAGDAGASTQGTEANTTPSDQTATTDATSADELAIPATNRDSTAAPQNWPEELRAKFETLPDDGRAVLLDLHKGMQGAFTKGMQAIRQQEAELGEMLQLREQFQVDPRSVLAQLAKSAGVEVFFERPLPEGEVPQFESAADMAKWAAEQATKRLAAETAKQEEARQAEMRTTQAREGFKSELTAAAAKYPDFANHREGIMAVLSATPALSVDAAYRLATYEGLRKLAVEGQAAKKELLALKKQTETQKANATRPGPTGTGDANANINTPTDPFERAYQRGAAKIAARN
jgi:hypothetical protein